MSCSGPSAPTEQEVLDLYLNVRSDIYKRVPDLLHNPHPLLKNSRIELESKIKDMCKEILFQVNCENW